ncbi:hypothetical protein VULLAG_LOCUS950 [Vulpes lagopus]
MLSWHLPYKKGDDLQPLLQAQQPRPWDQWKPRWSPRGATGAARPGGGRVSQEGALTAQERTHRRAASLVSNASRASSQQADEKDCGDQRGQGALLRSKQASHPQHQHKVTFPG